MFYAIWSCRASCSLIHFKLNYMLNLHNFLSIKRRSGLAVFIEEYKIFLKTMSFANDCIACIADRVFTVLAATLFLLYVKKWALGTCLLLQGTVNANTSSQKRADYRLHILFVVYLCN